MEVDSQPVAPVVVEKAPKKDSKPATAPSSKPPSPKPARAPKEAPPPLPQGSGLISNALFGGVDDSTSDTSAQRTPNIIVHIPLQGNGNKIINFARLAEEQYGFAALYPQVAARQERMARVAAAGAALEKNDRSGRGISAGESADEDLSMEVDRDSELEGAGASGGTAAQANEPADGKKRRRRRKMEEYDRDDPFVDDSEMVWQEQAAASKDGYFVYSGPLVAEGEKVQVERYVIPLSIRCYICLYITQRGWHNKTRPRPWPWRTQPSSCNDSSTAAAGSSDTYIAGDRPSCARSGVQRWQYQSPAAREQKSRTGQIRRTYIWIARTRRRRCWSRRFDKHTWRENTDGGIGTPTKSRTCSAGLESYRGTGNCHEIGHLCSFLTVCHCH
jgi:hypothetical protein